MASRRRDAKYNQVLPDDDESEATDPYEIRIPSKKAKKKKEKVIIRPADDGELLEETPQAPATSSLKVKAKKMGRKEKKEIAHDDGESLVVESEKPNAAGEVAVVENNEIANPTSTGISKKKKRNKASTDEEDDAPVPIEEPRVKSKLKKVGKNKKNDDEMVEIPGPVEVKRSKGKRKIKPEATLDEEIETLIPASVTTKKKKKKDLSADKDVEEVQVDNAKPMKSKTGKKKKVTFAEEEVSLATLAEAKPKSRGAKKKAVADLKHLPSKSEKLKIKGQSLTSPFTNRQLELKTVVDIDLSGQSLHQLMNNPRALAAGVKMLQGLNDKTVTAKELNKKIGFANLRRLRNSDSESSMCSTNNSPSKQPKNEDEKHIVVPTRVLRSSKKKNEKENINNNEITFRSDITHISETDQEESVLDVVDNYQEEGVAVLQELAKRSVGIDTPECDMNMNINSTGNQFAESVISDYATKKKLVEKHTKNIKGLSSEKLKEYFAAVVPEVAAVYNGRKHSIRHEKFKEGLPQAKKLKELNVTHPFNDVQSGIIIDLVYDSFFADKSRRYNWSNYVCDVLVPEVFLRIYARVNNLTFDMAEKEMLLGENYEGVANKPSKKYYKNYELEESVLENGDGEETLTFANEPNDDDTNDTLSNEIMDDSDDEVVSAVLCN